MSTSALIAYKNEDGNYNVNSIHFDGYIDGVGKMLQENYNDIEAAEEICDADEIRSLEKTIIETEFYENYYMRKWRKNLSFEKLCNESGNFNFTYVFENGQWFRLDNEELINY